MRQGFDWEFPSAQCVASLRGVYLTDRSSFGAGQCKMRGSEKKVVSFQEASFFFVTWLNMPFPAVLVFCSVPVSGRYATLVNKP